MANYNDNKGCIGCFAFLFLSALLWSIVEWITDHWEQIKIVLIWILGIILCLFIVCMLFGFISLILKKFSDSLAEKYCKKADELYKQGKYEEAMQLYEKTSKINKKNAYCYYSMGLCANKLTKLDNAVKYFSEAICINRNNAKFYYAISEVFMDMKKFEFALDSVYHGLSNSNTKKISENASILYKKFKDNENEIYKQILGYIDKKEYPSAQMMLESFTLIFPNKPEYTNQLNEIIKIQAEAKERIENEEKAITHYNAALKSFENKSYEQAKWSIEKAIVLQPQNNDYKELLQKIEYAKSEQNKQESEPILIEEPMQEYIQGTNDKDFTEPILEKINIETCTKKEILTLEGFDESKAEQFIKDREIMKWYDLDSFADYFQLQPHERVMLEDKLIFPLKPQVKRGRAVDF